MINYKLISIDIHMTEHRDCFKPVQKVCGQRTPWMVENPEGTGKGLCFVMEGLEPGPVG